LGARPALVRAAGIAAVTLLCGAATAACGPIVFLGLMVPHLVRAVTGPDLRLLLPSSAVAAAVLTLAADVLGRVVARPGEVQVGVLTVVLGGPFFLYFVRRRKVAAL
ncbi:iron ABC transporter permease, partial [Actinomadura logoneensis]